MSPDEIKEQIVAINNAVASGLHFVSWERKFMQDVTWQFEVWEQAQISVPLSPKQEERLSRIYTWLAQATLREVKQRGAL